MKIGDKVCHKRREGVATIIHVEVKSSHDPTRGVVTKTEYLATYEDGSPLTFYGFNIGKTIFKYEPHEQLSFLDQINK